MRIHALCVTRKKWRKGMTPEEKARVRIDQWLTDAGWKVVNRDEYEPNVTAVAIREGLLKGNLEADYFLFINGKAVGVLEAKREEVDISSDGVSEQVMTYAKSVPNCYQAWLRPLPFLYKSNGKEVDFLDFRDPDLSQWETINRIHTPKEFVKMLGIDDPFAGLPTLSRRGLRDCQYEAVSELERSLRSGQKRALIVLATGAGKTYTACLAAYRLLNYTPMRRILFLVDRNNLGRQAESEFGTFRLTESGDAFNTIFAVNRLKSSEVPSDSNVVISTIQRLFSLLSGKTITDTDDDDIDTAEAEVPLPDNPKLPHDFFDLIVIDECHRSIYGNWHKVLEYFDTARLVGLTATPVPETMAFFNNNRVVNYTLTESIVDGVNVDCRIYRIKTQESENGGVIKKDEKTRKKSKYTGDEKIVTAEVDKYYSKKDLNRSVVNLSQIKLILSTYCSTVYTEMFNDPQREPNFAYLPKTLIFALNENHAKNIVKMAREVFAPVCPNVDMSRFVQSITYSAGDSNELIRQFRVDKDFRIAVTCTLVATGTDVKPLEVLIFMRDVSSASLYTQMRGRGVRTIGDEQLRNVTPNAFSKDFFILVDAVGVTEHEHTNEKVEWPEQISLRELLERIAHGNLPDEYLYRLASVLSCLFKKADCSQRAEFKRLAHEDMQRLAKRIYDALDPDTKPALPPYVDIEAPNTERKALVAPIANHADARKYILILHAGFVDTLLPGSDVLISAGFSHEEAQSTTEAFEQYCQDHRDEIEALRIIYNKEDVPINYRMLKDLENKLKMANNRFSSQTLWNSYAIVYSDKVRRTTKKEEAEALTNIIQLVRFAFHQTERLESIYPKAMQLFNLWAGQKQLRITHEQRAIVSKIVDYIAANGACTLSDLRTTKMTEAARLMDVFGNAQNANDALKSVYNFVVFRKTA